MNDDITIVVSTGAPADGHHTIICTCGERITYSSKEFADVEAMRHRKYHTSKAGKK